jgi:hypothetical protein
MADSDSGHRIEEEIYGARARTFHGFIHLTKWFAIHAAVILIGLFFWGIQGAEYLGIALVVLGVATLIYGAATTRRAARKAAREIS